MADIHALVVSLLDATAIEPEISDETRAAPPLLPLAFLIRARAMLRGVDTLHRADQAGCGADVIVRSIFEFTATACWLLDDFDRNKVVVQSGNRDLRRLAKADPGYQHRLDHALAAWRAAYGDEEPEGRIPGFEQILTDLEPPLANWYSRYVVYSVRTHPSLYAVDLVLDVPEAGAAQLLDKAVDPPLNGTMLGFAAALVWMGFMRFYAALGIPIDDAVLNMGRTINEEILGRRA